MSEQSMTYKGAGVDYDAMDPFKRAAQLAARQTAHHLERFGYTEVEWSRGESCYLYETPTEYRGRVNEGLGTKNLVADEMHCLTGELYYGKVAVDTIAMIVNDMITLGCLPVTVDMHVAAGSSDWFRDERRCTDLVAGWKHGCDLAHCAWAGGETPTLKSMVDSQTVVLSGSADGVVSPKEHVIKPAIQNGDAVVFLKSSGIHANGLTMAREVAAKLPEGYLTKLPNGQTYGEALLQPTAIYVSAIETLLNACAEIHYAVNITGHGWRKLMRATEAFVYIIDNPGEPSPLFSFMQEHGPIGNEEAYGNFNMGAGFALYVPQQEAESTIACVNSEGVEAWVAGHIEKHGDEKSVIIDLAGGPRRGHLKHVHRWFGEAEGSPNDTIIEFTADSLSVR